MHKGQFNVYVFHYYSWECCHPFVINHYQQVYGGRSDIEVIVIIQRQISITETYVVTCLMSIHNLEFYGSGFKEPCHEKMCF